MFAMLKAVSAGIALVLVAGVATPVSATTDCVRIGATFFKNGVAVSPAECAGKRVAPMKEITSREPIHTDRCEGKPKGHEYLALGPDGRRMARYVCRGS